MPGEIVTGAEVARGLGCIIEGMATEVFCVPGQLEEHECRPDVGLHISGRHLVTSKSLWMEVDVARMHGLSLRTNDATWS